jgi:hypothetical protein
MAAVREADVASDSNSTTARGTIHQRNELSGCSAAAGYRER